MHSTTKNRPLKAKNPGTCVLEFVVAPICQICAAFRRQNAWGSKTCHDFGMIYDVYIIYIYMMYIWCIYYVYIMYILCIYNIMHCIRFKWFSWFNLIQPSMHFWYIWYIATLAIWTVSNDLRCATNFPWKPKARIRSPCSIDLWDPKWFRIAGGIPPVDSIPTSMGDSVPRGF